ncbi:MAG: CBS domain-containing protein [Proteobacteria bacterium]|nr:CBS domain-containing protein [Pseudomonadota bacterium]MBU1715466.1 CBS domain-containing protein [Pseudomonadota bacterium]
MKVKDIMEPVNGYLLPTDTLKEAVNKMRVTKRWNGQGMKGMVVLDQAGDLVGIMAIKDIMRAALPTYVADDSFSEVTWDGMLEEMAAKAANKTVAEYMSPKVITVYENDSLMKCAEIFLAKNLQRLPVLNEADKLVGVVYIRDIYHVITKVFHPTED